MAQRRGVGVESDEFKLWGDNSEHMPFVSIVIIVDEGGQIN